ncbi:glycosyltransferase family 4 protein [Ornithinimicrobium pekingense]|uniref:D-inositol 3-phosphate glycosyltransferase n=1 Tax=Ornithinimicrobium pekingense TaxID=384677 RepID=A0ABQ2FAD1_9MICO|nr:glycosyltransferase family 4 protein [Ornithinimicrobium pekingense]GGK74028.1 glycosyl transferase [Ornithinimicrobium pekingense]
MKIMLVTALVAGGVGSHVRALAGGLAADGHRVVVACPPSVADRLGPPAAGVTYVDVPVGSRPHPVRDRRAVRLLRGLMHGADVVHAHGLRAGALTVTARRVGRAPRPRLVVTTHNAPPEGRAARAVYAVLEQVVAHGADQVLCVSPDLVDRAHRAGAAHPALAVVPAPSADPVPEEERRVVRARVRRGLGLAADGDVALVVNAGRLSQQKDQATLVEAVDLLTDGILARGGQRALPVLVVAGEGPARPALEARVSATHERTDVRLVGHRADLPDLLVAADVVVSSARWEGQPVWLQEALHAGAPVVATDVGGTSTVLGDAGLLVDGGTGGDRARALADALARVLDEPALREDLRRRSLERAAQLPTQADAVRAALTAYRPPEPG